MIPSPARPHLLLLDHEDSFSATLEATLVASGARVTTVLVEREASPSVLPTPEVLESFHGVVLSPGPGHPKEYPATLALLGQLARGAPARPVLGVCLGLQQCAELEGARIERVPVIPVHGRRVEPVWDVARRFRWEGREWSFEARGEGPVVLFNSLGVPADEASFLAAYEIVATAEECVLVAVHRRRPWILVQSHPESFASVQGKQLLAAFVRTCGSPREPAV